MLRLLGRDAFSPGHQALLVGGVERLHRPPDLVDLVGEQIADQQIGDGVAQVGVVLDEVSEAEAVVVLADQAAHAVDALVEVVAPRAELGGAGVALLQAVDDRIGGELAGLEREQHARRIERIEEPERIADQHPAVAGARGRAIRVVARREIAGDALRVLDALLDRPACSRFLPDRSARDCPCGP